MTEKRQNVAFDGDTVSPRASKTLRRRLSRLPKRAQVQPLEIDRLSDGIFRVELPGTTGTILFQRIPPAGQIPAGFSAALVTGAPVIDDDGT